METRSKKIKLSSQEVPGFCNRVLTIDDLPPEMCIKILSYLEYKDLCRVGRVSKKLHATTRCPIFWTRVDVHFTPECGLMSEVAMKFVQELPPHVTHLRLSFENVKNWNLNFEELSTILQNRCPNLQVLVFHCAKFADKFRRIHLHEQLLENIHILAFNYCSCPGHYMSPYELYLENTIDTSKFEVLDISGSKLTFDRTFVSKIPHVKKLYLAGSHLYDSHFSLIYTMVKNFEVLDLERTRTGNLTFKSVCEFGSNLVELYMCNTSLSNNPFIKYNVSLPRLQKLCIRNSSVPCEVVNLLLEACKSLRYICVGERTDDHTYDIFKANPEKVHITHGYNYCNHSGNLDHMQA